MAYLHKKVSGSENLFAYEHSFLFSARYRRNRLIGLWAAEAMGQADPQSYASDICDWSIEHFSDEQLIEKITQDFQTAGKRLDLDELSHRMVQLLNDVTRDMRRA